jgi:hypothetical protein
MAKKIKTPKAPKTTLPPTHPTDDGGPINPEEREDLEDNESLEDLEAEASFDETAAAKALSDLKALLQTHNTTASSRRLFVRPISAVRTCLHLAQQAAQDRKRFALLHKDLFDMEHIDTLELRAMAFWYAETVYLRLLGQRTSPDFAALLEEAAILRAELLRAANYLWGQDEDIAPTLHQIRLGRGTEDTADDLLRLSELWLKHWHTAKGLSRIQKQDAEKAATLGSEILKQIDFRPTTDELKEAAELRNKAWSFLDEAAQEVIDVGRFLFRHQDPAKRYPSLKKKQSQRTKTKTTEPLPTPQNNVPNP